MFEDIKTQFAELTAKISDPDLIKNQSEYAKVGKEQARLKIINELVLELEKIQKQIADNQEIIASDNDLEFKKIAEEELAPLIEAQEKLIEDIEDKIHPDSPNDARDAIIEIRAGAGGDESALFTADLFRMYNRFAERQGWKTEILDSNRIGIGGFKEIIFAIHGKGVYGLLKYEAGTHRVQRVPETEKQGRVHTSTSTVVVLPEAEEVDIVINPQDIRIDTFCSSGPGGQSVNTTYSAIRVTHLPTGLTVSCQDQKSQHQNKERALQILRSRLLAKIEDERLAQDSKERKEQVGSGDRSDKIKTYNFPQDRLTDHRINHNWHNLTDVLDGNLLEIITTYKKAKRQSKNAS